MKHVDPKKATKRAQKTAAPKGVDDTIKVEDAPPAPVILSPTDPITSARRMMAAEFTSSDGLQTLHRHKGEFLHHSHNHYRSANDEAIKSKTWLFCEKAKRKVKKDGDDGEVSFVTVPFKPTSGTVANITNALQAVAQLDEHITPPAWLTKSGMPPANELFACANGLVHLPTGKLYEPTPDFFNRTASEVVFDPDAPKPKRWLRFVKDTIDDQQSIELFQEFGGYALTTDTSQQKILLAYGERRSGKGTAARVLTNVLGVNSVAGPTVSSLSDKFGLEDLISKQLAIVADARIGARTDKSAITERLLSISGEDQLNVQRKYLADWSGRLPTRIMILTNELPSLSDGSGALAGRFLILRFVKSFYGKEDPNLTNKLLTELSGILNWFIEGYRRLLARGHFIQPKSAEAAMEEIETLAAPIKAFLRDHCEKGPGRTVEVDVLYAAYQTWCENEGIKPFTKSWFGRDLNTAVPGLDINQTTLADGRRPRVYNGVALVRPPVDQRPM